MVRWTTALVLALALPAGASAQRQGRVGAVRVEAEDTTCWSTSQVPCETVERAEVVIRTGAEPVRVHVVSVEVQTSPAGAWQSSTNIRVLPRRDYVRTQPRQRRAPIVDVPRHTTDSLSITFDGVRGHEGRVRITLDLGGRRVVLEAEHRVVTESPDPSL